MAETELSGRQAEMIGLIRESGRMLEGLLNDVLDFAKIESGHLTTERRRFDLGETLASVFHLFAAKADEKGLHLETSIAVGARGVLEGHDLRDRQVVCNLLRKQVQSHRPGPRAASGR